VNTQPKAYFVALDRGVPGAIYAPLS